MAMNRVGRLTLDSYATRVHVSGAESPRKREWSMASYKYGQHLVQNNSDAFDRELKPGEAGPWSGIYRCTNCGDEVAANANNPLPPQNHRQHTGTAPIRWKLLVYAVQQN
jgi:hypothetical protein